MTEPAAPAESLLDERLEIETPERVKIVFDLAGIGSRFAAGAIDVFLLGILFLIVSFVYVIAASVALPHGQEATQAFVLACAGGFTVVLTAYYVGFEWLWSGQTPGKRLLKLRVIGEDGGPASPGAIFLRNILRVADLLPVVAPYGLGGVVMFVNSRAKRIGDFAAGTIVVRERAERLSVFRAPAAGDLPGDAFEPAEVARAQSFVLRSREMMPSSRVALARRLAGDIAKRHGLACDDAERFLLQIANGRALRDLRDEAGPQP